MAALIQNTSLGAFHQILPPVLHPLILSYLPSEDLARFAAAGEEVENPATAAAARFSETNPSERISHLALHIFHTRLREVLGYTPVEFTREKMREFLKHVLTFYCMFDRFSYDSMSNITVAPLWRGEGRTESPVVTTCQAVRDYLGPDLPLVTSTKGMLIEYAKLINFFMRYTGQLNQVFAHPALFRDIMGPGLIPRPSISQLLLHRRAPKQWKEVLNPLYGKHVLFLLREAGVVVPAPFLLPPKAAAAADVSPEKAAAAASASPEAAAAGTAPQGAAAGAAVPPYLLPPPKVAAAAGAAPEEADDS